MNRIWAMLTIVCLGCSASETEMMPERKANATGRIQVEEPLEEVKAIDPKLKAIYDAMLRDVLLDERFESTREFYGTLGDQAFALVSSEDYGIPWPESYTPSVEGFKARRVMEGSEVDDNGPRLLGIRLDKFDIDDEAIIDDLRFLKGQIEITILNAGGNADGGLRNGGCSVYYDAIRDGEQWTVRCNGAFDS